MFYFRIINLPDGNQIIDPSLKTPYNSLTPLQFFEYVEMDVQIELMNRMERTKQKKEKMRRLAKNPLYRLACFCGLV
jgi:hypothetical protein